MKRWIIAGFLLLLAAAGVASAQQTVFRLYATLKGTEIVNDMANPTGAQFTTTVLANFVTQQYQTSTLTTVAKLPTCNAASEGWIFEVTDASSPTYNATLTGSSTSFALAVCNGTNWTAH